MAHQKLTYAEWCFKYGTQSPVTMMAGNSPTAKPAEPPIPPDIVATAKKISDDLFARFKIPKAAMSAPSTEPARYALSGPEAEAPAENIDPETVLCVQNAKAEYAADRATLMRAGISEEDFITSRKVTAGLATLIVR
jgi:hypothetical protein